MDFIKNLIAFYPEKANGRIVRADVLSGAKGRFDRKWFAQEGGLWMAISIYDEFLPENSSLISLIFGLVMARCANYFNIEQAKIKWINDLHLNGRKIGGVLLERFDNSDKFPGGAINSMNLVDVKTPDAWSSDVAAAFEESKNNPQAYITFSNSNTASIVSADITVEFAQALTGNYNLSVFVVENGVEAPQKHFSEGLIEEYEHSHILRASMNNGIIGDFVATNPTIGIEFEKSYILNIDTEWVADSLHVIPFIYNTETNMVVSTKIIKPKTE